jgi:hypothetical protein
MKSMGHIANTEALRDIQQIISEAIFGSFDRE